MSVQAISWALTQRVTADKHEQLVLILLANYAGEDGRHAFPSVGRLARESRMSEQGVRNALARLESAGLVRRGNQKIAEAHIDRADRRPVVYDLNLALREPVEAGPECGADDTGQAENAPADDGERATSWAERGPPGGGRAGTGSTEAVNGLHESGERGPPGGDDPSINHQETVARAREPDGGRQAEPPAEPPDRGSVKAALGADAALIEHHVKRLLVRWLFGEPFDRWASPSLTSLPYSLGPAAYGDLCLGVQGPERRQVESWLVWAKGLAEGRDDLRPPPDNLRDVHRMVALYGAADPGFLARAGALLAAATGEGSALRKADQPAGAAA